MPLDFPTSPTVGDIYTFGGRSWQWNGSAWDVYVTAANAVTFVNGFTGSVTIAAGSNVTVSSASNTITISSTGTSGGAGISGPYVISLAGLTGTVGLSAGSNITITPSGNTLVISSTASGSGISGPYVISLRGLSGAVGITNSSGINLTVSGNTLTFTNSGVLEFVGLTGTIGYSSGLGITLTTLGKNISIAQTVLGTTSSSQFYPSFYSVTSGIAQPFTDNSFRIVPSTNTLIGYGGMFLQGLSLGGLPFENSINLPNPSAGLAGVYVNSASNNFSINAGNPASTFGSTTTLSLFSYDILGNPQEVKIAPEVGYSSPVTYTIPFVSVSGTTFAVLAAAQTFTALNRFTSGISVSGGTFSGTQIFVNGATFSANISAPNIVNSVNGITGSVNIAAGSNITITPSGNTLTIASTASGGGSPAGTTGSVQFNTGTAFGGSTGFIWDNTNQRLGIGLTAPTMALDVSGSGEFTGDVFVTTNFIKVTNNARHWFL